jgi:hypothetical protein
MKRKLLVAALAVAGCLLAGAVVHSAAEKKDEAPKKAKAPYVHTVLFTMKKDAPKEAESELVADCHEMLAKVPSVRELRAGRPAEKGTPSLAKKDFSVALTVCFDDYDGLMAYDKHELHQKFVKKHLPNIQIDKLLVYDSEDQAK